ncbi:hypothetical protein M9Y10_011528 [Tritrichomonas musculus]|uniref:Uncharacterized protein n=1 Tax=Tritrichomonas musculus TaxID=1915356 RepID=A0ABR2GIC3_9EUKA
MISLSLSSDSLVSVLIQPMLKDEMTYRKACFVPEYQLFGISFNPDNSVRQNSNRETNCLSLSSSVLIVNYLKQITIGKALYITRDEKIPNIRILLMIA